MCRYSKAEVVCDPSMHTALRRKECKEEEEGVGECAGEGDASAKRKPVVLFVDDSVAEHLDPRLAECGVHRVLFGRAL